MDRLTYQLIHENKDLLIFLRENPIWYRYLSRDPNRFSELTDEAKVFHGQTFSQRTERISNQVQMLHMLFELSKSMND